MFGNRSGLHSNRICRYSVLGKIGTEPSLVAGFPRDRLISFIVDGSAKTNGGD